MEPLTYSQLITATLALLSAVISTVALRRVGRVQEQQLRLQRKQEELTDLQKNAYFADRRIALAGVVSDSQLVLRPSSSEQQVNKAEIYFPTALGVEPIVVVSPELGVYLSRFQQRLRLYWDSHTPVVRGSATVRPNVPVPVFVRVFGHTKGTAVQSAGVYDLYAEYCRPDQGESSLRVQGLSLNNHWTPVDDPQVVVDQLLEEQEKAYPPSKERNQS